MDHTPTRPIGASKAPSVPVGTMLGRYVVLHDLGAGGEGRVYLAYDPVLERKVAVKVLRARSAAYATLLREARVLAKLAHPHVVSIHDVVDDGDQPFMAMELMQGESFLDFAAGARPDEVLEALIDVADAIAAAHEADLVHGDVKPSNILRSAAGETKLSDFGLARAWSKEVGGSASTPAGTPAYLAPEQIDGGPCSPATDQYAFCLTAWVAFHGRLPWSTESTVDSQSELACATNPEISPVDREGQATRIVPRWTAAGVPSRVARALTRGLQLGPADRWPDLRTLWSVLATAPRQRRIVRSTVLAAAAVATVAVALVATRDDRPCTRASAAMDDVWTVSARRDVLAALEAGPAFERVGALVEARLGEFARDWSAMSRASCEATRVHQTQSDDLLDRRRACLDDALAEFTATLGVLSQRPAQSASGSASEVTRRAHHIVGQLPALSLCEDLERLQHRVPPPTDPDADRTVREGTEALARVKALRMAGRYDDARELFATWDPRLTELGYAPSLIALDTERQRLADAASDYEAADAAARRALERSLSIGDLDTALEMATSLTIVHSSRQRDYELASRYREIARGLAERDGVPASHYAAYLRAFANTSALAGDYDEAVSMLELAVATSRAAEVSEESLARVINDLAVAYEERGDLDASIASLQEAIALRREALGPGHPENARALHNLSQTYLRAERLDDAESAARQGLSILQGAFPADHADVAYAEMGLANFLITRSRFEEATTLYEGALASLRKRLDATHPHIAIAESSLGGALVAIGRADEGVAMLRAATEHSERALGPDHPQLVDFHANYGSTLMELERYDEAATSLERAVQLARTSLDDLHTKTLRAVYRLAEVYRRQGRPGDVLELIEPLLPRLEAKSDVVAMQLVRLRHVAGVAAFELGELEPASSMLRKNWALLDSGDAEDPRFKAATQLNLAKVLWSQGGGERREEAQLLAAGAQRDYRAAGEDEMAARARAWLDEHA